MSGTVGHRNRINNKNIWHKLNTHSNDIRYVVFISSKQDMYSIWEEFCFFLASNGQTLDGFFLPTLFYQKFANSKTSLPLEIIKIIHQYCMGFSIFVPDTTNIIKRSFTAKSLINQTKYQYCVYYFNTDTCQDNLRQHIYLTDPKYTKYKKDALIVMH
mmetsp:Transcript_81117/g.99396  ORF Transcript_81117/g.99396 Transcript_81117/m.99396 type:complete len:158 (+) Transcript_81117:37-510(+)